MIKAYMKNFKKKNKVISVSVEFLHEIFSGALGCPCVFYQSFPFVLSFNRYATSLTRSLTVQPFMPSDARAHEYFGIQGANWMMMTGIAVGIIAIVLFLYIIFSTGVVFQ
jgi:hypothetical protein